MIKYFEMFAGYGTASFALKRIFGENTHCIGFSEIDKYAVKCFEHNHKVVYDYKDGTSFSHGVKNYGDCKRINPQELPDFDLLTGGFPCQAFSVAGKMQGELDSRGTLFNEIIRIAEVKQPKYMLLENVKGLTAKKFKPTFDKILSELDRIGYNVYWKVLNTKDYGIPQSRARVWFVCFRKDIDTKTFKFPEPQELKIFIKDILETEVDAKYYLSEKLQERFRKYLQEKETKIAAMRQRDRHNLNEPREQQIEPRDDGCSNSITTVEKDNLVIDTRQSDDRVYSSGVSPTLRSERNGLNVYEGGRKELRTHSEGVVPTLKHRMGTGGNNVPMIANCLDANMSKGISPKEYYEQSKQNVVSDTITTAVGRIGHSSEELGYIEKNLISSGKLRRLTPKECFRLQGFLNDEVNLDGLSDTQCYKLAGNGQSVNVVELIFKEMFKND